MAVLTLLLASTALAAVSLGGVNVPPAVDVGGERLRLNGAALQSRFIFDVTVVSFYAPSQIRNASDAVSADEKKHLRFHLLRDLSQGQLHNVVKKGLAMGQADRLEALQPQVRRFLKALPAVKKGDIMSITFVPGEGTTLRINGKPRVTIDDEPFSEAIFAVWLGPKSIDRGVQKGLLTPRQ